MLKTSLFGMVVLSWLTTICVGKDTPNNTTTTDCVNALEYVKKVGSHDHTKAINMAMDAARNRRKDKLRGKWHIGCVYFPPGTYTISDTINIEGLVEIFGHAAKIVQKNPEKDIFYSGNTRLIDIHGLSFYGGKDQIALGNRNIANGFLKIRDCFFWYAKGVAVRALFRFPGDTQSTYLLIDRCWFRECHQVLVSVSDYTAIRNCWIRAVDRSKFPLAEQNKALIEHRRGNLLCQDIMGIPKVTAPDLRWIDNYGSLTCERFRFGGEGAGYTPVVHKTRGGRVVIKDSELCTLGNNRRPCAVYCENMPSIISINDSGKCTYLKEYVMLDSTIDPKTYYSQVPKVRVPKINIPGSIPEPLQKIIAVAKTKSEKGIDWGEKQLNEQATKAALEKAMAKVKELSSAPPSVMKIKKGNFGHRQQTDPKNYIEITPSSHKWDLTENMDGSKIACSEYIALAAAGDDVVLMNRIDGGKYPHIMIKNVEVDLDKTPILSWRMKDNGQPGGTHTIKIIDADTREMWSITKGIFGPAVFDYLAWDLRKVTGKKHGKVNLDLKFYLMGRRRVGIGNPVPMKKGDYLVLDFIRLEAAGSKEKSTQKKEVK